MIDGFGADYVPQVMGQCWIGEFDWVDRISHHPELPPVRQRTYRDEKFIKALAQCVRDFLDMKNDIEAQVRARGIGADLLEVADAS
jgi:hypothetical protein